MAKDKKTRYKHFVPSVPINEKYKESLTLVLIESIEQLKNSFEEDKVVAWDTETTGLNPEQSEIVGFSYSYDGITSYYCPVKHVDLALGKPALDAFYDMLKRSKYQILYNARFDFRMMEYSGYDMSFVFTSNGTGKPVCHFIDVMNLVWLSDTNDTMPTLKASTLRFLGYQPPKFLETLGDEQNFQYVPVRDAYEYACLDAANTYNLFKVTYKYYKEAGVAAELDNMCLYIIGQLEKQPLKIDTDYVVSMREEVGKYIEELRSKIFTIAGHEFNINSGRELTQVFLELGIDTGERTKAGDMKTSKAKLDLYHKNHPECVLMDYLVDYKESLKLYNSYLKTLVEIAKKQEEIPPRFSYKLQSVPCLTAHNVVLVKDKGIVSISEVTEGDYIWTQYGYKKVLWNHSHKVNSVTKLFLTNGSYIEGTGHHPVLTNKGTVDDIKLEWVTLDAIEKDEEVILNHHTPPIYYDFDDAEHYVYLFYGVVAAGILNKGVRKLASYKETIKAFLNNSEENKDIVNSFINDENFLCLHLYSLKPTDFYMFLLGFISLSFQMPEARKWNRPSNLSSLSIYANLSVLLITIQRFFLFLGIPVELRETKHADRWKLVIHTQQGMTLFKYMFLDSLPILYLVNMFRKYNPSGLYKEYASTLVDKKETIHGETEVYDIEVEDVHEYVANGIVTHNTGRFACVTGDTIISTILGNIPISELYKYEQGNEVFIDHSTTAPFQTLFMGTKSCVEITMDDGSSIKVTHDHKFRDNRAEWVRADTLIPDDSLLMVKESLVTRKVVSVRCLGEFDVWTLTVEHPTHQYVSNGFISHNCGKDGKNSYFAKLNLQSIPKPKSNKSYGRRATQEEIDNKKDLLGWVFSPDHPEWSEWKTDPEYPDATIGMVVEGMSPERNVRNAFKPEHGEDDYLVSIDMSGEELRVVTNLYHETAWADIINSGGDLHHQNSNAIFGAENYTKETRKRAKGAAFGMLYGQGPVGFQQKFPDMTLDEAREFLIKFKKVVPNIIKGQEQALRQARKDGVVYTAFHRPRRVRYYFESTDRKDNAFGERTVKNTGIQGTAADVLKLEFVRLWERVFTKYPDIKFHSTIHDEINFSVPRRLAAEVIPIMIECMTVKLKGWLVPLDCSLSVGYDLGSLIPFTYNTETKEFIPAWEEYIKKADGSVHEDNDKEDFKESIDGESDEDDDIDYNEYDDSLFSI